jgi:hypothetical protein
MPREESGLNHLNRLFEEAIRQHGDDLKRIAHEVTAQIAALEPQDRLGVDGALERLLAFRPPDCRRGPPN